MKKATKIIYWVATIWLCLGMLSTAIVQLMKSKEGAGGADSIARLGYPLYFLTLIGIWKVIGVIAVLLPKLRLAKEWAYAGFFFLMSGAAISHAIIGEGLKDIFPALLLLVLTILSWYFRPWERRLIPINK